MIELALIALLVPVFLILGMWLVVVIVRRSVGGDTTRGTHVPCDWCGRWTPAGRPLCDWCGRELRGHTTAEQAELSDLAATERQLRRMLSAGALRPAELDALLARIRQYRTSRLGAPQPAPPAAPGTEEPVELEIVEEAPEPVRPPRPPERPRRPVPPRRLVPPGAPAAKPQAAGVKPPAPGVKPGAPGAKPQAPVAKPQAALEVKTPAPQVRAVESPPAPRRTWSEVLGAFMEDRNIRIGELVGGLLFVVFSVLLVVSLWDKLTRIPYYQFFIFVAISSAVFGVGLYAHHRWRLESTSLSLLVIATLLVPLNFLTMVGISKADWNWISVIAELVSLGVFTWLAYQAARVLVPGGPWHQVAAVLGNSAAVLVLGRLIGPGMPAWQFLAAGLVPVAFFGGSVGSYLLRLPPRERLDVPATGALFTLLGTAAFALVVPLGLMVAQAAGSGFDAEPESRAVVLEHLAAALERLAVLLVLGAMPILAGGLTVMRGTTRDKTMGAYRTAGTCVALLAVAVMLAALWLAWPMPLGMTAVSLLSAAALLVAAFRYRVPFLHWGVIAFAATGYLTLYHYIRRYGEIVELSRQELARDMISRLVHALTRAGSARSAVALVALCAVLGVVAAWLARGAWRRHALVYARGAGAVAVLSLLLVTLPGFLRDEDAMRAMFVYAVYGAASLALNVRWRNAAVSYLGLVLLTCATLWAMPWPTGGFGPYWAMFLAVDALAMVGAAVVLVRMSGSQRGIAWAASLTDSQRRGLSDRDARIEAFRLPLLHVGEAVAVLALGAGLWTAWHGRAAISLTLGPVVTALYLAVTWLLLAWAWRSRERTWLGSMIGLAGLVHAMVWNYPALVEQPWLVALLSHATLAVAAGLVLELWTRRRGDEPLGKGVRRVFIEPLGHTALLSSVLVLPLLPFVWDPAASTLSLALCLFWLSGVWLVVAWTTRSAAMMAAHQAVLAGATVVATTAWLERQNWAVPFWREPFNAWNLQAYGMALAALSLLWVLVRIALRRNGRAKNLLDPGWPSVDRVVFHTLVTAQLALLAAHLLRGCYHELVRPGTMPLDAFGPGAWGLFGVLAVTLLVGLWQRWRQAELTSGLLLAVTVPCLIAGQFANDLAAASVLRWGLGLCFLAGSVAVWQRRRVRYGALLARTRVRLGGDGAPLARRVLLGTAAAPVLALTLAAAMIQLAGLSPGRPAVDVFFHRIDLNVSYLVPLLLVMGALVGSALRERSAGYAFGAGLVAEMAVVLGYALSVVLAPRPFRTAELVTVVQLATITAAVWAGIWLVARRWVDVWREEGVRGEVGRPAPSARHGAGKALMHVQFGMGVLGNVVLLVPALAALILVIPHVSQGRGIDAWTVAAGRPLGWLALVLLGAALVYRRIQSGRRVRPEVAGLVGMAALALLACTVQGFSYPWGYRTLMLGWASYALFVVAATWWVATIRTLPGALGPPQALVRAAALWVGLAGGLAVLLGIKAAALPGPAEDLLWAAAAIAVASGAGATMAYWRRAEGWAFTAGLGVNLAASLVVWYVQLVRNVPFVDWWLLLVQANAIATAAVALVWLAARRRLYALRDLTIRTSPLLGIQTTLSVAAVAFLLVLPVVRLVAAPASLPGWAGQMATPAGWAALLAAALAAGWYLFQTAPRNVFHVAGGLALALPVLLTCYTAQGKLPVDLGDWISYRVLMTLLAMAGLVLLGAGMGARRVARRWSGESSGVPAALRAAVPSSQTIEPWVAWLGVAVVGLAVLWSHADPAGVWWRARAILSVSVTAGLLALWLRVPLHVYLSGLLLNVAGMLLWRALGPATLVGLVQANVLCLAVGCVVWTVIRPLDREGVPSPTLEGRPWPFAHVAALAATGLLALLAATMVVFQLADRGLPAMDHLGWAALVGTAVALIVLLWDGSARFVLAGLYALGPAAIAMIWHARGFSPRETVWAAATELPLFLLAAAAAGWLLPRVRPVWRALRIPGVAEGSGVQNSIFAGGQLSEVQEGRPAKIEFCTPDPRSGRWPIRWFVYSQAALAGVGAALTVWISIDFGFDNTGQEIGQLDFFSGRLAGISAALLILLAMIVMAGHTNHAWRRQWHFAGFAAGLLLQCAIGWSLLDPLVAAPWLHRSVTLLVAATLITLLSSSGLSRILPSATGWCASGRRIAPGFAGLALLALVAVLAQESMLYDHPGGVPLSLAETLIVGAALVGLVAACLSAAIVPGLDRLGLSERGRTVYVYAAELLAVLLFVHFWLTMPELFQWDIIRDWWMLIVMGVAFAGAALSEVFHRRRMPVLSEPLEWTAFGLPVLPAIGFWFVPERFGMLGIAGRSPAAWLLVGVFYAVSAVIGRPAGRAIPSGLAALALNMGLWVFWSQQGIGILDHPQLWLIPVGLCVLVAEYLNHDRLTPAQSGTIRYLALGLIYVSSTVDMLHAGIGNSVWLPLALMFLCVAGVLTGILLRIQSFLILGITFLFVLIGTMVEYAAFDLDQIWVLWACGLATATAIIALFAVFEKRRNDVLRAAEKFKTWER